MKIDVQILTENTLIQKTCKQYWEQDFNGEFVRSIKEVVKVSGFNSKTLTKHIRENCVVTLHDPNTDCVSCGKKSEFTTREQLEYVLNLNGQAFYSYDELSVFYGISGLPRPTDILQDACESCRAKNLVKKNLLNAQRKRKSRINKKLLKGSIVRKKRLKRIILSIVNTIRITNFQPQQELDNYTALEALFLLCLYRAFKTTKEPSRVFRKGATAFFGSEDYDLKVLQILSQKSLIIPLEHVAIIAGSYSLTAQEYLDSTWHLILPRDTDLATFINVLENKIFGLCQNDIEMLEEFIVEGRARALMAPIEINTSFWNVICNLSDIQLYSEVKSLVQFFPVDHVEALTNIAAKDLSAMYNRTSGAFKYRPNMYTVGLRKYADFALSDNDFKFFDRSKYFKYSPSEFEKQLANLLNFTKPLGVVALDELRAGLVRYLKW